ncbi:cytochrome bc1 complex diheme cytochrome c subunit [Kribbia dieselivorans]|uniref:cytochrome bc1 complex diheme cytochrome c subunit n=1 Tax=Kribbia dieselivorans TaxID=331526 RepID=UPI000839A1DF|nr:c-type cytochrome [Kribbia dieselivorans]
MKALTSRRHPAALVLLLLIGLLITGSVYAALAPKQATAANGSASQIEDGRKLFESNCSTCHGVQATGTPDGPSLVGVGAAAVDFQVGTGRMPMVAPGPQAPRIKTEMFDQDQIDAMAAYVASLAPGPSSPTADQIDASKGDAGKGGELFRVNCAMCHSSAGAGGALTRGKYAPGLKNVEPKHIYEAMQTGPQSMPVFNDNNITPDEKRDIIAYVQQTQEHASTGGQSLGGYGPVPEGMFAWIFGMGLMVAAAVWAASRAN